MEDDSTPRDPLAAKADALKKALAEREAEKQAAAALAAKNAPQIKRNKALEKRLAGLSQSDRRKVLDGSGLRHISAAPRPIEPLRASGPMTTAKREDAPRKPIAWKLWTSVPHVALWEAVALLLGIEPSQLRHSPNGWMAGPGRGPVLEARSFPSRESHEAFERALGFAERAANYSGPIHLRIGLAQGMNKRTAQVSLAEVVAFFVSCEWPDIPALLLALVPTAEDRTAPPVVPVATAAESVTQTHELKRRGDALAAVLTLAKKQALDAGNWQSVWASLVALAQSANRPAPLLGYTEGEGVKYQTDKADRPDGWLTRDAYRARFNRQP